jgi:histidine triad (HIT) family protein
VPSHHSDGPPAGLTDHEWAAVDAVRTAGPLDGDDRRLLARAAEKLRIASLEPGPLPVDEFQVPTRSPCPYCENFAGRFAPHGPPAVIAEDDRVFVFLAPSPMGGMPGHTLVAARRHVETIFDLTAEEATALGLGVVSAARAVRAVLAPAGALIQQNNGVAAFQTVPHVHFHVVPQVPGPFPPAQPPELVPYEERAELAESLSRHWPVGG